MKKDKRSEGDPRNCNGKGFYQIEEMEEITKFPCYNPIDVMTKILEQEVVQCDCP
jgi:hypothetical protein